MGDKTSANNFGSDFTLALLASFALQVTSTSG